MHNYNEITKRLEPTETTCQFCNQPDCAAVGYDYFVPVFRGKNETELRADDSRSYKRMDIGVPRCRDCKIIHEYAHQRAQLYSWGASILFGGLAVIIFGYWGFFAVALIPVIGYTGAVIAENIIIKRCGIKSPADGTNANQTVRDFIIEGWTWSAPAR